MTSFFLVLSVCVCILLIHKTPSSVCVILFVWRFSRLHANHLILCLQEVSPLQKDCPHEVSVSQPGRLNFRDVRNLRHHSTQQLRRQMTEPRTSGNCAELSPEYSEFPFIVSCLSPWIFMPFINAFGCFLAGCLTDLFYRWVGSFTAELWLTSWIFFHIALCCPQLAVSLLCRQVVCIHTNSAFFDFKEDMERLFSIYRKFLLHSKKWNPEFFVSTYYSPFPHSTHLLKLHEEEYLAFSTVKYLDQTTWKNYLTIKSRCISTGVIPSRYFCIPSNFCNYS